MLRRLTRARAPETKRLDVILQTVMMIVVTCQRGVLYRAQRALYKRYGSAYTKLEACAYSIKYDSH